MYIHQQYVYGVASYCPSVVYELYILCCYILEYKNIFEYKSIFYMHLHSVTLSKMLHLGS